MVLWCSCPYVMCGTELAYGAMKTRGTQLAYGAICRRACYAMCSTDMLLCPYAMCGTERAYGAMGQLSMHIAGPYPPTLSPYTHNSTDTVYDLRYVLSLCTRYARCPVLTSRIVLPAALPIGSNPLPHTCVSCYALARPCAVLRQPMMRCVGLAQPMMLRRCAEMCGTDIGCAATPLLCNVRYWTRVVCSYHHHTVMTEDIGTRYCHSLSPYGTDIRFHHHVMSSYGTDIGYRPTRSRRRSHARW
eukprot:3072575-Rhodomonas_salina.4